MFPVPLVFSFVAVFSSFQVLLKCYLLGMLSLKYLSGSYNFYSICYSTYYIVL